MRAKCLQADKRRIEYKSWERWMSSASKISKQFYDVMNDDPFAYNETASVSVLSAAAAKMNMLSIAEYDSRKRHRSDLRVKARGRCDLWMAGTDKAWAFEFKQAPRGNITRGALERLGEQAERAARRLYAREADERVAGLILSTYYLDQDQKGDVQEMAREYAKEWHYAWEIPTPKGSEYGGAFFFFFLL